MKSMVSPEIKVRLLQLISEKFKLFEVIKFLIILLILPPLPFFAMTIDKEEEEIQKEIQTCKSNISRKVEQGLGSINKCDCKEDEKKQKRTTLNRLAEREKWKCEITGIDKSLAFIDQERKARIERLKNLKSQFETQVKSYQKWSEEISAQYDKTVEKISEIFLISIADIMIKGGEAVIDARIEDLMQKVNQYKDIRKAKKEDIKNFVNSIRAKLKGVNKQRAKKIVLQELKNSKINIGDMSIVGRNIAEIDLNNELENIPIDGGFKEKLEQYYRLIITSTELAANHGSKAVLTLGKAVGVLSLAPDIFDAGVTLWTASVDEANITAMDQLQNASTQELSNVSKDLKILIDKKKRLEERKHLLQGNLVGQP